MGTVNDILNTKGRDVCSIGPDMMVYDAVSLMAEKEIGALLVMDGEKLAGGMIKAPKMNSEQCHKKYG